MREPVLFNNEEDSTGKPFSQLSLTELAHVAAGDFHVLEPDDTDLDIDFAQRYAAILLKERGQ